MEKIFSAAIDWLLTRNEVDGKRLAVIGASWGGYWAAALGVTEKDRLRGAVVWGGPVHTYFQRDWQVKALGTREYLFDLFAARASVYRVSTLDDFLAYGPRMSLQARGLRGLFVGPRAPALLLATALWIAGYGLRGVAWTTPAGEPLRGRPASISLMLRSGSIFVEAPIVPAAFSAARFVFPTSFRLVGPATNSPLFSLAISSRACSTVGSSVWPRLSRAMSYPPILLQPSRGHRERPKPVSGPRTLREFPSDALASP